MTIVLPAFRPDRKIHAFCDESSQTNHASEARIKLHAEIITGINDHHKAEALFKALGRALDSATRLDERILGRVPSTPRKLLRDKKTYIVRILLGERLCPFPNLTDIE